MLIAFYTVGIQNASFIILITIFRYGNQLRKHTNQVTVINNKSSNLTGC